MKYQQPSPHTVPLYQPTDRITAVELRVGLLERSRDEVHMMMHGFDGSNGVRGNQRRLQEEVSEIKRWRHEMTVQWQLISRMARWSAIVLLFLYGTFGASPTIDWAAKLLGNAQKIVGG